MAIKLNSFILSDDAIHKMKDKREDTMIKKVELGFSLCRRKNDNILHSGNDCEGTECKIKRPSIKCKSGEIYEGLYHTHPRGFATPSIGDLLNIYGDGLGCIGSPIFNSINCYIRESQKMSIKVLGMLAFEHLKFRIKDMTDEERELKLKNLTDKYFRKVAVEE